MTIGQSSDGYLPEFDVYQAAVNSCFTHFFLHMILLARWSCDHPKYTAYIFIHVFTSREKG
jgi:hypothetical protein